MGFGHISPFLWLAEGELCMPAFDKLEVKCNMCLKHFFFQLFFIIVFSLYVCMYFTLDENAVIQC